MSITGAPGSATWDTWTRRIYSAVAWFALGFAAASGYHRPAVAPIPGPVPPPITAPIVVAPPAAARHTGHFTVSYIEPRYPSPASAAVRSALAGTDWHPLDATFRAYTDGQQELTSLGFVTQYSTADLPVCFIQETRPDGTAPIVPPPLKSPASAADVVGTVKGLRGGMTVN